MEDTDDEIDFANLIELFDTSYYDEDDSDEISLTLPKVKSPRFRNNILTS